MFREKFLQNYLLQFLLKAVCIATPESTIQCYHIWMSCEGVLTRKACLEGPKSMYPNKTPGTDVLTAEFYNVFPF